MPKNYRFRRTWLGKAVLQVHDTHRSVCRHTGEAAPFTVGFWRDATHAEAIRLALRLEGEDGP